MQPTDHTRKVGCDVVLAMYLFGTVTGMFIRWLIIAKMIDNFPTTICHYCQYERERMRMRIEKPSLNNHIPGNEKHICFYLENDIAKHEVTIRLPKGRKAITLPEAWVHMLIEQLTHQIQEWK